MGDLNDDGLADVAVVTSFYFDPSSDWMLYVYLQQSSGQLGAHAEYPLPTLGGYRPRSVDIGDVTGDGLADIVVGNDFQLVVFRQEAGGLAVPVTYPSISTYQVKVGDFNHDGRGDVVGIDWGVDITGTYWDVHVFLQNAQGTLDSPVIYVVPHGGWDEVEVGDLNGDGRDDIAVMSGQLNTIPNLGILLQDATGGLTGPFIYDLPGTSLGNGIDIADVTNDGRDDLVVTYSRGTEDYTAVMAQNAAGTLDPPVDLLPPVTSVHMGPVEAADLNGDGRRDLVVKYDLGSFRIHLQDASGQFGPALTEPFESVDVYGPQSIAIGDVNDDGELDLLAADAGLVVIHHKALQDLGLEAQGGAGTVGSSAPLTTTVTNHGSAPATGVVVTHQLPAGVTALQATPTAACSITAAGVTCFAGTLAPGASATFVLDMATATQGKYDSVITASAAEPDPFPWDDRVAHTLQFVELCVDAVSDGDFEAGTPNPEWIEASATFGTPLCTVGLCGNGGGTAGPNSGLWWAWFGRVGGPEQGSLTQTLVLQDGTALLRFRLWIGVQSGNGMDRFRVLIDGTPVFTITEPAPPWSGYSDRMVDVTPFADGASHTLRIEAETFGPGVTNFSVDGVTISSCPPPRLEIEDAAPQSEGEINPKPLGFRVSLTPSSPETVTVAYSTGPPESGPEAVGGLDYVAASGVLTFLPGTFSQTIVVPLLEDSVDEFDESFAVRLSYP